MALQASACRATPFAQPPCLTPHLPLQHLGSAGTVKTGSGLPMAKADRVASLQLSVPPERGLPRVSGVLLKVLVYRIGGVLFLDGTDFVAGGPSTHAPAGLALMAPYPLQPRPQTHIPTAPRSGFRKLLLPKHSAVTAMRTGPVLCYPLYKQAGWLGNSRSHQANLRGDRGNGPRGLPSLEVWQRRVLPVNLLSERGEVAESRPVPWDAPHLQPERCDIQHYRPARMRRTEVLVGSGARSGMSRPHDSSRTNPFAREATTIRRAAGWWATQDQQRQGHNGLPG